MRIIAIANQKGGVGKTTTSLNLGVGLAQVGQRVLLIDGDPQANLTVGLLGPKEPNPTLYEFLGDGQRLQLADVIVSINDNLDVLPSSIDLAGSEVDLLRATGGQMRLANRLKPNSLDYRYVIIDVPPSLGLLTINALHAADEVIIPVSVSFFGLRGIIRLENTIRDVQENLNRPSLHISGVLATMTNNTNVAADVEQAIRDRFGDKVFKTVIPQNISIEEAHSRAQSVLTHAPKSKGSIAYGQLVQEVLQRG